MGSINQLHYLQNHRELFREPYLEVGSKDYGDVERVKSLFPNGDFTGIDMLEGKNVDHVLDLTQPFEKIDHVLRGKRFQSIFCLSVMEHCLNPFAMAQNISQLLAPGGVMYVSVPFSWKFHGYPSDYWRFTPEGVKVLFPELTFAEHYIRLSTDIEGDLRFIDEDIGRFRIKGSWYRRRNMNLRGVTADMASLLGKLGPLRWLTQHRYLMPPVMIEMIGEKSSCS